jgi:hypothetical protein
MSNHHQEFVMTKVKTLCASGALLLVGSTLALAEVPPSLQNGVPSLQDKIKSAVRKQIEGAGYSFVYGITPSFDGYHARAMESGQRVIVDVDGNGNVRRVSQDD